MTASRVEAELKYTALIERPLQELEGAAWLGPARLAVARTVAEVDRYVDTADLRLAAAHWACRLRSRGGRTIVSLKGPAQHAAGDLLHLRPEVEGPANSDLDAPSWPPSPARDQLLAMTGRGALVERFSLEQERTERAVSVDGSRIGELSLDRVRVVHEGIEIGRMAVVELELDADALAAGLDHAPLSVALSAVDGLAPDPSTKLERALAMLPVA
ncbi:MAG: CYTH domain-containing protein [Chloroflexi bacterium]|nr:CYTH domain-containing protein [Chloroflexota bacterium]